MSACGECGKEVIFPDYRHGNAKRCGACDHEAFLKRSAGYDRAEAMTRHPAGKRRRKIYTEWWLEPEHLGSRGGWKPVR